MWWVPGILLLLSIDGCDTHLAPKPHEAETTWLVKFSPNYDGLEYVRNTYQLSPEGQLYSYTDTLTLPAHNGRCQETCTEQIYCFGYKQPADTECRLYRAYGNSPFTSGDLMVGCDTYNNFTVDFQLIIPPDASALDELVLLYGAEVGVIYNVAVAEPAVLYASTNPTGEGVLSRTVVSNNATGNIQMTLTVRCSTTRKLSLYEPLLFTAKDYQEYLTREPPLATAAPSPKYTWWASLLVVAGILIIVAIVFIVSANKISKTSSSSQQ